MAQREQIREPDPAQRPARLALYGGLALIAVGGVVLYLGYNGAATHPVPQAQTPYVISGGLLGIALMALGGITAALAVLLRVQADLRTDLSAMRESIERLADATAARTLAGSPSANGTVLVTPEAGSFHRPDCKLVARAEHVRPSPRSAATDEGLAPCRVCKP